MWQFCVPVPWGSEISGWNSNQCLLTKLNSDTIGMKLASERLAKPLFQIVIQINQLRNVVWIWSDIVIGFHCQIINKIHHIVTYHTGSGGALCSSDVSEMLATLRIQLHQKWIHKGRIGKTIHKIRSWNENTWNWFSGRAQCLFCLDINWIDRIIIVWSQSLQICSRVFGANNTLGRRRA